MVKESILASPVEHNYYEGRFGPSEDLEFLDIVVYKNVCFVTCVKMIWLESLKLRDSWDLQMITLKGKGYNQYDLRVELKFMV